MYLVYLCISATLNLAQEPQTGYTMAIDESGASVSLFLFLFSWRPVHSMDMVSLTLGVPSRGALSPALGTVASSVSMFLPVWG